MANIRVIIDGLNGHLISTQAPRKGDQELMTNHPILDVALKIVHLLLTSCHSYDIRGDVILIRDQRSEKRVFMRGCD